MPEEQDWCKTAEPAGASNTIGIATFALILPALLSGAYISWHGDP